MEAQVSPFEATTIIALSPLTMPYMGRFTLLDNCLLGGLYGGDISAVNLACVCFKTCLAVVEVDDRTRTVRYNEIAVFIKSCGTEGGHESQICYQLTVNSGRILLLDSGGIYIQLEAILLKCELNGYSDTGSCIGVCDLNSVGNILHLEFALCLAGLDCGSTAGRLAI